MKSTKRRIATALTAGAISLGVITIAAPAAHAAKVSPRQCLAGARWLRYTYDQAWDATTDSDSRFWATAYLEASEWMSENC